VQATWTDAFAAEMLDIAATHPRVVSLSAAMVAPTGLRRFAAAYPGRVFDVGIAEQHAVASAAGLATGGLHPVFAVYSTFLNRAFDQVLMDVALHRLGVTFVLDRAGVTGPDGPSHHGAWDVSLAGIVPGMKVASPRDRTRLRACLTTAVETDDGPTLIRYSKAKVPDDIPALTSIDGLDVLARAEAPQVLIVGCGEMATVACEVARLLDSHSIPALIIDPVWTQPVPGALVRLTETMRLVVTIEDNLIAGGFGSQLELAMDAAGITRTMRHFGLPTQFLAAGTRAQVLARVGLTPKQIALEVVNTYARLCEESPVAPTRTASAPA
jgi:1-deoxy-D-xylulose-5-phosphate synthase